MARPDINIDIPEIFSPLLTQSARYKVFCSGRGAGKSWACARAAIIKAVSGKYRILACREVQSSIRESVHKLLCDTIQTMGLESMFDINEREIRCHVTGSEFIFEGLWRNSQRIKSLESIDICWIEEGQTISEESLRILIPTVRNPQSEFWIIFNPKYKTDPVYVRFVENQPDNCILVKHSWRDNPYFPDVLRKEMEDDFAYRPETAKNTWDGECLEAGAHVWIPPYDKRVHVKDFDLKNIKDYKIFQALDPHTAFYSAAVWAARWKKGDRYYTWIYDEYPNFSEVSGHYSDIRKKLHYKGTLADMSRTFFARETGKEVTARYIDTRFAKGFGGAQSNLINNTVGLVQNFAKKENGGILFLLPQEKNIDAANDRIKKDLGYNTLAPISEYNEPCLYVSPSCKNTIRALTNHRYMEESQKEEEEFKDFSDVLCILEAGLSEYRWPGKRKSLNVRGGGSGSWMGN